MKRTVISTVLGIASVGMALCAGTGAAATNPAAPSAIPAHVGVASAQDRHVAESIAGKLSGVVTAAGGWNRCPNGDICLFDGYNGQGAMAYFRWGSPDLAAQGFSNRASSSWARTSHSWSFFDFPNYGYGLGNQAGGNASNFVGYSDNRMSSLRPS